MRTVPRTFRPAAALARRSFGRLEKAPALGPVAAPLTRSGARVLPAALVADEVPERIVELGCFGHCYCFFGLGCLFADVRACGY